MQLKEIKNKKFFIRENSLDEFVIRENCYSICNFNKNDIWLDIGGNIGIFPIFYCEKVKEVISFEPDKDNICSFIKNIELNNIKNYKLVEKAVIGNDDKIVEFFINTKKNKGSHSIFNIKGSRDKVLADAININEVLKLYNPNCIKLDIEGAEYEVILAINDFSNINQIVFEYHTRILKDSTGYKFDILQNYLLNNGFNLVKPENKENLFKREYFIAYFDRF